MATATRSAPGPPIPPKVRWACDEFHEVCDSGLDVRAFATVQPTTMSRVGGCDFVR